MNNPPLALFRCDAGTGIGSGHVGRCLALAEALAARGWHAQFAGNAAAAEVVASVGGGRFVCHTLPETTSPEALRALLPGGCTVLVADHYGLDAGYETPLRGWARAVAVIDDLADRPHACDLLLDQTAGRAAADYHALVPAACRILTGPTFALLRGAFAALRPQALARDPARPLRKVLVAPGGVDGRRVTPIILDGLAASGLELDVTVVLGGRAATLDEVRRRGCTLHVDTPRMAELLADTDLAIGAGGVSAYERCCLGVASLVVQVADNQTAMIAALAAAGAVHSLGGAETLNPAAVAAAVRALAADSEMRTILARNAAELCDGHGAETVAAAMAMLV